MSTTLQDELLSLPVAETVMPCQADAVGKTSMLDRLYMRAVLSRLQQLKTGRLSLVVDCDQAVFGDTEERAMNAEIDVHDGRFFSRVVLDGAMGAADSYLAGEWSSPDLTAVFRVLLKNEGVMKSFRRGKLPISAALRKLEHFRNRNSRSGSKRNIHEHYDLGNEFFQLFLDPSMMYSSAIFETADSTLEEASWAKLDRVCRRLQLTSDDHVVEIGTGWGGFAFYAARNYGCRVTTTTISDEQYRFASNRIQQAGLQDKVTVLKKDYRDLDGQYDKLVSLEMIEAVGRKYLPEYFRTCSRLIHDSGAMLLQAITIPEQRYDAYASSVDFIQKYIFPGGFLPSVELMQQCVRTETDLRMLEVQDFGMHYATTLRRWSDAFENRLDDVRNQGFNQRFIRMWRYYLAYCEAGFMERATGLAQLVWAKPGSSLGQVTA